MQYSTLLFIAAITLCFSQNTNLWKGEGGKVNFTSDAPLELIQAESNSLRGIINQAENKFAFSVDATTFKGFNSTLQQEHFHENYIESRKYPTATFAGKFIEDINKLSLGKHNVRAKGSLKIHGVVVERIIKCTLEIQEDKVIISSNFIVPLEDHNINIPQVVYQKIAEEIEVNISLSLNS